MGKFSGVLLASDYDDTLIAHDGTYPARNARALDYFTAEGGRFTLPLGVGENLVVPFPEGGYRCAASGAFRSESTFVARAQLVDTCIGSLLFELSFDATHVTLMMHRVEETLFREYDGFVSGRREG